MIGKIKDFVDDPKAIFVFAHGAGANMHHTYMNNISMLLNDNRINVLRFNFPYMDKRALDGKRYPPNRMPQLVECFYEILTELDTPLPIFIGGKSMGGRVAATVARNEQISAKGVVCIGYPFHPQKQPEKLRLEPLQQTKKPVLILQGERDALGSETEISNYQLSTFCQLKFFEDGDHDLKPRIKSGFTQQQHIEHAITRIVSFIDDKC